jgi:hypothetical protein
MVDTHGRPTLIDFGASRAAMAKRSTTLTAIFTPGYAATEQFASAALGPWTDIYGLAATLYHAITGRIPPSSIDRILKDTYQPLSELQPEGYAPALLAGIDAGMAVRVDERPQSIVEWRRMLRSAQPSAIRNARKPGPLVRATSGIRRAGVTIRGPALWGTLAAAVVLIGSGYLAFTANPMTTVSTTALNLSAEPLERALAERRKAEAEVEKLKAEAARREVEVETAGKKRLAEATARQQVEAETRRKVEEQRKTTEDEAKARTIRSPSPAFDTYDGSLIETTTGFTGGGRIMTATLRRAGTSLAGQIADPRCGPSPVSLNISSSGEISGTIRLLDTMACSPVNVVAGGKVSDSGIQLELHGVGTIARGTLVEGRDRSAAVTPGIAAASPQPPSAIGTAAAAAPFNGIYAGSLSTSTPGGSQSGMRLLGAELRISGNRLTGQLVKVDCGTTPISLSVEASGEIAGGMRIYEPIGCSLNDASASGKVSVDALTLHIRGLTMSARGSLSKRSD